MNKVKCSLIGVLLFSLVFSGIAAAQTKLVFPVHWSDFQLEGIYDEEGNLVAKGLNQYVEEYMALNPDIEIEIQFVPFEEYLQKIQIAQMAGMSPDIMQVYSPWGVSLVDSGVLALPPADVVEDVAGVNNYPAGAVAGTTIGGQIWGFPTEVGNYCLVYNKKLLAEAGFTEPPATWAELVDMASKITKYDAEGNITQYGYAFLAGWDTAVVHPFLALLWSNGGEFLSEDYTKCLVNSQRGVATLEAELNLFEAGGTDAAGSVWDFPSGIVGMMIMASWFEADLKLGFGEEYENTVGVAPVPILKEPAGCSYTWFACVGSGSKHQEEAWNFLKWYCSEVQPATNTTREGDLMANCIGSLPARNIDLENHPEALGDLYTQGFVDQLQYGGNEPNVYQGAEIKTILMNEIVKTWNGQKTAKQALDDAAAQINEILAEFY